MSRDNQLKETEMQRDNEKPNEKIQSKDSEKMTRSEWINLLGYIVTLMSFYPANQASTLWLGEGLTAIIARIIIFVIEVLVLCETWQMLYAHSKYARHICTWFFQKLPKRVNTIIRFLYQYNPMRRYRALRFVLPVGCLAFVGIFILIWYYCPETSYYSSVSEIYGIPRGIDEPLSSDELKERAFYWEIKEYPLAKRVVLTYMERYQQVNLLREYSTAYNMEFFRPCAKVEYRYTKNVDKFRAGQKEAYQVAAENGYRELEQVSYYGSDGKLLMKLDKIGDDRFEISTYSVEDMPQLFQSTLLLASKSGVQTEDDSQMGERDLTSQQIEVIYNSDGLPEIRRLHAGNKNLCGVNGEKYAYNQEKRLTALCYLDINGEAICNDLGIMLITFQYDRDGNLLDIRYFSDENGMEKTEGFHGVFCEKFAYDSFGNLTRRKQLDRSGDCCYDMNGVYIYQYTYKEGMLIQEEYLGFGEEPIRDNSFHSSTMKFVENKVGKDREISITFDRVNVSVADESEQSEDVYQNVVDEQLDLFMQQTTDFELSDAVESGWKETVDFAGNYASVCYRVNKKHCIMEEAYYDKAGNLMFNEQGYAVRQFKYDEKLQVTEESFYGINGQACLTSGGYAAVRNTYVPGLSGVVKMREYLGVDGKCTLNRQLGYSSVRYDRTDLGEGRKIVRTYFDVFGKPVRIRGKDYAVIEQNYDANGRLIRTAYQDEENAAVNRSDYGVAEILYEYDEEGNKSREWYKDVYGQPINRSDTGYAVICQEFEDGRLTMREYKGYQDQALVDVADKTTGIAMVRYSYEQGSRKEQYFDTAKKPVLRKDTGYSMIEYEYDEKGRNSVRRFYDTDGNLTLSKDMGCAVIEYQYNAYGQKTSSHYYGVNGQPVISSKYQCAGFKYVFDESGNETDIYYLGQQDDYIVRRSLGVAHIHMEYDQSGNLIRESYFDADGKPTMYNKYGYASYTNLYDNGRVTESRYFDMQGNPILSGDGGYAIVRFEYDDYGQCVSKKYSDEEDNPIISSSYQCAGYKYIYDNKGNKTDTYYLGLDGRPMTRQDLGFAQVHYEYDGLSNEKKESYFDENGRPAIWKEGGCAAIEFTYDHTNIVERRYLDKKGNLLLRPDTGYAVVRDAYDDFGRCISKSYYDDKECPVISTNLHCAGLKYQYDEIGQRTDIWYIGLDGKSMIRQDLGYARLHTDYDELGNEVKVSCLDTDDELAIQKDGGYAFYECRYDNGNCVERCYFDKKGNPVLRGDKGYASVLYEYDDFGQCIAEFYRDITMKPIIHKEYHCAGHKYAYDVNGRRTDTWYIGLNGKLMIRSDRGYAHIHSEYDVFGNEIRASYYDENEDPTLWKEGGNASCEFVYEHGNCMERRYFDINGELMLRGDTGYAVVQYGYDDYGNCILESYYDREERPIISKEYHCAGCKYAYDEKGNRTDTWYIGMDGDLMVRRDLGYAQIHREYDEYNNEMKVSYFDANGQTTVCKDGSYASCRYRYDGRGRCIERAYFGIGDSPVLRTGDGYSVIQYQYNELGQCSAEFYLGTGGNPIINTEYHCAGRRFTFDVRGNQTDTEYLDLDGTPMMVRDWGYAQIHWEYDEFDNTIKVSYLDLDGKPAVWKTGGYTVCESKYDNKKCVERRYLDERGNLIQRSDEGYASIRYTYDEFGQLAEEYYRDSNEEPTISSEYQCAGRKFAYDERGNCTDIWYVGLDGEWMNREDIGYAHVHYAYDDCGIKTEEAYFDKVNEAVVWKDRGYTACKFEYDNGRCIKEYYLDDQENLVLRNDGGYAVIEYRYDEFGQRVFTIYWDDEEHLVVNTKYCYAAVSYEYDEMGHTTYIWYWGKDNKVSDREDIGVAMNHFVYDEYGHWISNEYSAVNPEDDSTVVRTIRKDLGYAVEEQIYEDSMWMGTNYFDADGNLIVPKTVGYAMYMREYNDMNQVVRELYYNAEENLINYVNGEAAIVEYTYDASGNVEEWTYYDKDNNPL